MTVEFRTLAHSDLAGQDLMRLRALFDRGYFAEYGPWDPDAPYGYSPAEVHVIGFQGELLVGHLGFQPRRIRVGGQTVTIAGVGGVLVADEARGTGIGQRLMNHARAAMQKNPGIEFGYLGGRPEIVRFYESTGWRRVHAMERHVSRLDQSTVIESAAAPILICDAGRRIEDWPAGDIDLCGGAW